MHATIAVFGAILTTVYGALYQLGTMFTQTELHGIDEYLQPIEEMGHPVGVILLAVGKVLDTVLVAQVGTVLILAAALAFSTILGRKTLRNASSVDTDAYAIHDCRAWISCVGTRHDTSVATDSDCAGTPIRSAGGSPPLRSRYHRIRRPRDSLSHHSVHHLGPSIQ